MVWTLVWKALLSSGFTITDLLCIIFKCYYELVISYFILILIAHCNRLDMMCFVYSEMFIRWVKFFKWRCMGQNEKWRYYSGTPEVRACPLFSRRFLNGGTIVVLQRYEWGTLAFGMILVQQVSDMRVMRVSIIFIKVWSFYFVFANQ